MRFEDYAINIAPLPVEEGGGYLVTLPDLPGCIADGETIDDAVAEARDAFNAWAMAEMEDKGGLPVPKSYSGQFVQRIPKTLHMRLAKTRSQRRGQPEPTRCNAPCARTRRTLRTDGSTSPWRILVVQTWT